MKTVIGIVILAAVVGGLFVLNDATRTEDGKSRLHVAGEPEIMVEIELPEQGLIIRTVQAPGEVEPLDEVDISSEVVAKVIEMAVEEGDYVRAGELLCRLDDADYKARVVSAEANVAKVKAMQVQAEADLRFAERNWDEAHRLHESGAMSEIDHENMRTALLRARAMVTIQEEAQVEGQAVLEAAREDLQKTVITAPLSGVVAQRFADLGEVVITGTMNNPGTRIMVISDLSKMQVRCKVDEADVSLAAPDQPARIYLQSDTRRSIPGRVLRVGTKGTKPLGRDVVTFETLVLITGDDPRIRPGMTANVEIEVARREDALMIPVEAVVYRKRRDLPEELVKAFDTQHAEQDESARQAAAEYIKIAFCVEDDKAYPRLVQTGINDATRVEVLEGIGLEDQVVIGPYRSLDQLKEGAAVKVIEKPESEDATDAAADEADPNAVPEDGAVTTQPADAAAEDQD